MDYYTYNACHEKINSEIIHFTKEGLGVRNTARILHISTTTLLRRILIIAKNIKPPMIPMGKEYEVDELCTYVGNKDRRIWFVCAMEKVSRNILIFNIGSRTNQTLRKITESIHLANSKKIFTDRLQNYKSLIEKKIHKTVRFGTNHLERFHLTLRTHLKKTQPPNNLFLKKHCSAYCDFEDLFLQFKGINFIILNCTVFGELTKGRNAKPISFIRK